MPTLDGKKVTFTIDASCTRCGQCVRICPCEYLEMGGEGVGESPAPAMGCITCGHCAAVCPRGALHLESEGFASGDVFAFPSGKASSYEELFRLFCQRRSIRSFQQRDVPANVLAALLEAAQQAPAGLPPSTVEVIVLNGPEKVRAFAFDFLDEIAKLGWLFSRWGVWCLRPFMSSDQHRDMRNKIVPLYQGLMAGRRKEQDFLFYDAPLAMIFLCEGDPADAVIAATYAMTAAETLGLGSCMIGTVTPMLSSVGKAFRARYQVPEGKKEGLAIIFGYPRGSFARAVRRAFKAVRKA